MVDIAMANRVKRNDRVNIIRSLISASVDMVAFEIGPSPAVEKRCRFTAALALTIRAAQYMSSNRCCTVIDVDDGLTISLSVARLDGSASDVVRVILDNLLDRIIECFLIKVGPTHQIENDLIYTPVNRTHLNRPIAAIKPFSIEAVLAVFFEEKKERAPILDVVSDLAIVVSPGITLLSSLAIVFVGAILQESIVVAVSIPIWVGDDNHSILVRAMANPHDRVSAKDVLYVQASMEYVTNMFVPGHLNLSIQLCFGSGHLLFRST